MKLNQHHKETFVRAVCNALPEVDYMAMANEAALKIAVKNLPKSVRDIYDNVKTRPYVGLCRIYFRADGFSYDRAISIPIGMGEGSIYNVDNHPEYAEVFDLMHQEINQRKVIKDCREKLKGVVMGCSTLKQLKDALPEFEAYMPVQRTTTPNLPAVSNVIAEFVGAGFPFKQAEGV